jgi:hypothetical protein
VSLQCSRRFAEELLRKRRAVLTHGASGLRTGGFSVMPRRGGLRRRRRATPSMGVSTMSVAVTIARPRRRYRRVGTPSSAPSNPGWRQLLRTIDRAMVDAHPRETASSVTQRIFNPLSDRVRSCPSLRSSCPREPCRRAVPPR